MTADRQDIYQRVTNLIVKAIEEGAERYCMPWRTSGSFINSPINAVTKKPYRGINVLVLWATAQEKRYNSGLWATYKQWQELGAQVRKGEKAAGIVFWKFFEREAASKDSNETKAERIPMARDYAVFNAEQVDGYQGEEESETPTAERIEHGESFFSALEIDIRPGGNTAYYSQTTDAVHMPAFTAFDNPAHYYSVLSHETTHWTGADTRLNRDLAGRFGSETYAFEELIAELGSAFLCSNLGIPTDPRSDHAPYISSWLRVLKNDKKAIFTAAAKAQQAVDWLENGGKKILEAEAA